VRVYLKKHVVFFPHSYVYGSTGSTVRVHTCTSDPCVRVYCSCVRVRMEVKRYLFPEIDTVRVCTIHVRKYFGKYFRTPEIVTSVLPYEVSKVYSSTLCTNEGMILEVQYLRRMKVLCVVVALASYCSLQYVRRAIVFP
jgi:hypothetical protein